MTLFVEAGPSCGVFFALVFKTLDSVFESRHRGEERTYCEHGAESHRLLPMEVGDKLGGHNNNDNHNGGQRCVEVSHCLIVATSAGGATDQPSMGASHPGGAL